jgi:hypothetical protein
MRSAFFKRILPVVVVGVFSGIASAQFTFDHIGSGATGSLTTNDLPTGSYTLIGGGDDIWDTSDNFDFAHYTQNGDFDVQVRVESLEFTATWTKAGLMAREQMTTTSRMLFNRVTPDTGANDTRFAYRTGPGSSGGQHEDGSGNPGYPNAWLRLKRQGASVTAYRGSNGSNWVEQGVQNTASPAWPEGPLANTVQLGLAVSRHSGGDTLATCEFRNFGQAIPTILTQPANALVSVGQNGAMSVGVEGSYTVAYQWYENGSVIPGATGSSYTKVNPQLSDNGKGYSVLISNRLNGMTILSSTGVLSVMVNPQVVAVYSDPNNVYVLFSKLMDGTTSVNPIHYSINNGVTVSGASTYQDGKWVRLSVSPLSVQTSYTLTITNVHDSGANDISPDPTVRTWTHGAGVNAAAGLTVKRWDGSGDINVILNKIATCVPPERVTSTLNVAMEYTTSEGGGTVANGNTFGDPNTEGYGAQIYGLFVPPVTGNYQFGLAADDNAFLYISSDDLPANKTQITAQPAWGCFRDFVLPVCDPVNGSQVAPLTANIPLVAGRRYYLEGLVQEGGGGDHISVTVRKPGDPAIVDGVAAIPREMFATNFSIGCPPTYFFGSWPMLVTANPQNTTAVAGSTATFRVGLDGAPPFTIQWYSNGVPVAGSNSRNLNIPASLANNGSTYYAIIANDFSSATSSVATLSTFSAPQLTSASSLCNPNGVYLTFTRAMDPVTALNPANYSVTNSSGPVAISAAAYHGSGSNVIRLTVATLTFGATYTVTATGVRDQENNLTIPNPVSTTFQHCAGVNAPAGLTLRRYDGQGGDAVSIRNLFLNCMTPSFTDQNIAMMDYSANLDNYGSALYGLFVAPVTGNYSFALSADDQTQMYISTDETPANRVLMADAVTWNGFRNFDNGFQDNPNILDPRFNGRRPAPVRMVAGRSYYIEAFFHEGSGGDHITVAVQRPGDPPIANGNTGIPRNMFSTNYTIGCPPTSFFRTLGPVTAAGNPNQTVAEGTLADFVIQPDGSGPHTIQWYSNGVAIAGANRSGHTFRPYRSANGAQFYAVVSNPFSTVTSAVATLTVNNDVTPPVAIRAYGNGVFTNVTIEFNEPVDPGSAAEVSNYSITNGSGTPLTIFSASIRNATNVVLRTDPQTPNTGYVLVVNGVGDIAGVSNPMTVAAVLPFTSWVYVPGFVLAEVYRTPLNLGNNINVLKTNSVYPYYATRRMYITNADSRTFFPNDAHEYYGARISGLFQPPSDGNYIFRMSNDDDGQVNGSLTENPAAAQTIINAACCNGSFGNASPSLPLLAANRYYFELLWMEGTGGDYGRLSIDGTTPIGPSMLGVYANPDAVTLVITQQPVSLTVDENQSPTFTVGATFASLDGITRSLSYQWYSNSVAIAGAIGSSYTAPPAEIFNDGDIYTVVLSAIGKVITSSNAILNVRADTNPPVLLSARTDGTFTKIFLNWSETLADGPAIEASSYYLLDPAMNQINIDAVQYSGSNVVLSFFTPLLENTVYSLEIDYQTDLAGNPTAAVGNPQLDPLNGVEVPVRTFVVSRGFTDFRAYLGLPGGSTVASFVPMPQYPNSPTFGFFTNVVNWPQSVPNIENYAMRFQGLFVAPETGTYLFDPAHDDPVRLRISNTSDPAGASANEFSANCCTGFGVTDAKLSVNMVAGQRYYYEVLVIENGGGDYAGLAVTLPSGPTIAPISATYLAIAVDPAIGDANNIGIAQQPQSVTIEENHSATFSMVVTGGTTMVTFQWQINTGSGFVDIPGATTTSYTTPPRTLADDGHIYRALVFVPGKTLTSSAATLDVITDGTKPLAIRARGVRQLNGVRVQFNERMTLSSVINSNNYAVVDGLSQPVAIVGDPIQSADETSVLVPTVPLAEGAFFTITISGVTDIAGNVLNTTNFTFQNWVVGRGSVWFDAYNVGAGNEVSLLTNHVLFPNSPDLSTHIAAVNSRIPYPTDAREAYGARISGYFVPQVTTNHTFYLSSDDASRLFLSTDASEANRVLLTEELGCCNPFAAHGSAPRPLVAGQRYFLDLLYKEGTGGDFGMAAVRRAPSLQDPNSLSPIPGHLLASLADPVGASITFTQHPASQLFPSGTTLVSESFNASGGGFTVTTPTPYEAPWAYNAVTGSWIQDGQVADNGVPNTSMLNSPVINVTSSGRVTLTFAHRHSFEGGSWDGGQVRVSINGGPFNMVPLSAFSANGYNGTVLGGSISVLAGQAAFVNDSVGHGSGSYITSVCSLGDLTAGSTVRVQFIAGNDGNTKGNTPNWEITSAQISVGNSLNVTLNSGVVATNDYGDYNQIVYQWQKQQGATWRDILGANGASYSFTPYQGTVGQYRVIVYIPGANATSAVATVTAMIVIDWDGAPAILQQADEVTGPWTDILGASDPYIVDPTAATKKFFRQKPTP